MSVILETKQLCKFYGEGENQVKAVNQVDLQIEQGEFVAIVGKSGSGKSTLLHKFQNFLQNSMHYFNLTQIDEETYAVAVEQIVLEAAQKALDLNVTFR